MGRRSSSDITFCIVTMNKTRWLTKTLLSIRKYCPIEYSVKLLVIGEPDCQLAETLTDLHDNQVETIVSRTNLGCGGGRRFLAKLVSSTFAMMLDDDMYLTEGAILQALNVLKGHDMIGAVSMPQCDLNGYVISLGGRHLMIEDGVVYRRAPTLNVDSDLIEVEDLDGGAMLLKSEMLKDFEWDDRYRGGFDDIDKSLQIFLRSKWKQAIVPQSRLIHDRSWVGQSRDYELIRYDGLARRRSYRLFRAKWGLRLDLRSHLLFELVYPALALTGWQWPTTAINKFTRTNRRSVHVQSA